LEPDPEPQPALFFLSAFPLLLFAMPSGAVVIGILAILLLLLASAMISGSEVAFFSLTHNDFALLDEQNTKPAQRILQLKEKPRTLLATILVSNNFINIAIILLSDFIVRKVPIAFFENISQWFISNIPIVASFEIGSVTRFFSGAITVFGVTFLLVLFGEVAPKIYAQLNSIRLAKMMSGPLTFLVRMLRPISMLLVKGTNIIEKKLEKRTQSRKGYSKEDLDEAIDLTVSNDDDTIEEIDILKGIVKFGDVSAKQIMRSRVDVIAVDVRENYRKMLQIVKDNNFSRLPIYEEDFDHVTGILYVKDLLGHLDEPADFEWQSLIKTDVLYIPESKKIDDLLKEFQTKKMHLAIVVDEYGGSSGIVTLEDILEEVIGDIKDEFDSEREVDFERLAENKYRFEGKTSLKDVCRIMNIDTTTFDDDKGEADTIAGLILEIVGFIPKEKDEYELAGYHFAIQSVTKRRIEQVIITLI